MNDELPELFRDVAPRPAPVELRAQTLTTVGRELSRRRKPRWERIAEWSTAAALLFSVGLNVWLANADSVWRESLSGPVSDPATGAIAGKGGSGRQTPAAGRSTGWVSSLWSSRPSGNAPPLAHYRQLLDELNGERRHGEL